MKKLRTTNYLPIGQTGELRTKRGFTLVEMLVVMTIFSTLILAATDIFIRVQRIQRKAAGLQQIQDVTRFLTTRMTREIQAGSIDYDYYIDSTGNLITTIPNTTGDAYSITSETLALRTVDGEQLIFTTRPNSSTDFLCSTIAKNPTCFIMAKPFVNQSERADPDGYTVKKLRFYITPAKNPFAIDSTTNDYKANAQPRVTIFLSAQATVSGVNFPINIQTTVSTREYQR